MAGTSIDAIAKILENSAKIVEEELDAELNQLKQLDEDDLERLRERRLEALRKAHKRKQVWCVFPRRRGDKMTKLAILIT